MGKVDLKRLAIMIGLIALPTGAYLYLSSGTTPPPTLKPPTGPTIQAGQVTGTQGSPGPETAAGNPSGPNIQPPAGPEPKNVQERTLPGEVPPPEKLEKSKGESSALGLSASAASLPDPFMGTTAELVRIKKEAEILDGKIKLLELKAKQAEAELKEKRARTLANMIEKNPRILFTLSDTKDSTGGITVPSPPRLPQGFPGSDLEEVEGSLKKMIQARSPTVKMVILGREKRVTIEFEGRTYTLSVGDKVQDMEVINVTPRGAVLKLAGKQEFIPVNESAGDESQREKKIEERNGNIKR